MYVHAIDTIAVPVVVVVELRRAGPRIRLLWEATHIRLGVTITVLPSIRPGPLSLFGRIRSVMIDQLSLAHPPGHAHTAESPAMRSAPRRFDLYNLYRIR